MMFKKRPPEINPLPPASGLYAHGNNEKMDDPSAETSLVYWFSTFRACLSIIWKVTDEL